MVRDSLHMANLITLHENLEGFFYKLVHHNLLWNAICTEPLSHDIQVVVVP